MARRMAPAMVGAVAAATMEAFVGVSYATSLRAALFAWLAAVGLWGLAATIWVVVSAVAVRLVRGPGIGPWPLGALARRWSVWRSEAGAGADGRRLGALAGGLVGVAIFCVGSVAFAASLIANRHGPGLIALTIVVGQGGLAMVAGFAGLVVARRGARLWAALAARGLGVARAIAALAGLAVAFGAAGAWRFWSVIVAAEGLTVGLALLALVVASFAHLRGRARRGSAWAWLAPLLALALAWGAGRHDAGRAHLQAYGHMGRWLLHAASAASDVDGDGSPAFPRLVDCRPFDRRVHPLAKELPGNGIDENCDGSDEVMVIAPPPAPTAPSLRREGPRPDFVLITVDSLRADHMGFLGYRKHPTTPGLDEIVSRAVIFEETFSQDSGTGPSLWSLMAGKTPFQVELEAVEKFPPRIGRNERLLAEALRARGYATSAILCGHVFDSPRWNLRRGFARYREICGKGKRGLAPKVTDAALQELGRLAADAGKPFFLWMHYYDPHASYEDHPQYDFGRTAKDRYDEEIRAVDDQLRRVWGSLSALSRARSRPQYVVFGADHGENFREHGTAPHARNLYRNVTRIPHFWLGPDITPQRVASPVAFNDVYPTMLELAGIAIPPGCTQHSQVGVFFGGEPDADRLVFQENSYSRPKRHVKGVIRGRWHYLRDYTTGREELYDMAADPGEKRNLVGRDLPEEAQLREALQAFLATTRIYENLSK